MTLTQVPASCAEAETRKQSASTFHVTWGGFSASYHGSWHENLALWRESRRMWCHEHCGFMLKRTAQGISAGCKHRFHLKVMFVCGAVLRPERLQQAVVLLIPCLLTPCVHSLQIIWWLYIIIGLYCAIAVSQNIAKYLNIIVGSVAVLRFLNMMYTLMMPSNAV